MWTTIWGTAMVASALWLGYALHPVVNHAEVHPCSTHSQSSNTQLGDDAHRVYTYVQDTQYAGDCEGVTGFQGQ